jgi:hypothetical protein
MTKRKTKIRKEIIEIIKKGNLTEFQNYFLHKNITIDELNNRFTDILIIAIEYNASLDIINYILYYSKYYTSLNYVIYKSRDGIVKTPLSAALSKNNFRLADHLIELGARINSIPFLSLKPILNKRNLNYLLRKNFHFNEDLILFLIENKKNFFFEKDF